MKQNKILVLDGAIGTLMREYGIPVGCNDILCLQRPEIIADIHRRYLQAGADIITTNSFNANPISLADYGYADRAYDIAKASAEIARRQSADFPGTMVAGSMGPTSKTLSMSPDVSHPAYREVDFDQLEHAYSVQAKGLIDGGADIILIETIFDTLNAKAAIAAVRAISVDIPIMLSATISDASGRMLSGQTVEAFCCSVEHARPMSVGLNCGNGARQLLPFLRRMAQAASCKVSVHPNAGAPNIMGTYDQTPEMFASDLEEYCREGLVDIVGGCCGTTPAHIAALRSVTSRYAPRGEKSYEDVTTVSGLEPLKITRETNFVNVGERTNVAGSAKFLKLIRDHSFDEALTVARAQVEAGAQVIDVCMDDAMIDGQQAMSEFVRLMASEPDISRVPLMVDSSHWATIEAGLKCAQGKCIVNSISLKEGEEVFIEHARCARRYGAAVVVMLFDEKGQADTFERKIEVAQRACSLLQADGWKLTDIIIDPNILAVATGMPEHDRYALDFIEATKWIKTQLPGAKVSGGVSNLSFAFRGNNEVRKAMHAAFLYHAINAGMDMGIVNPQMVQLYSDISPDLLQAVEDVILYRRTDAAERLSSLAMQIASQTADKDAKSDASPLSLTCEERISRAMLKGDTSSIEADVKEAYTRIGSAIGVINDLLMPAMEEVGRRFGEGKMFLPQVVKSARVMKTAVDVLTPYIAADGSSSDERRYAGNVVVATVKGDVHDIGKNIVSVVMACNGYRIHDLGVMVEPQTIIEKAREVNADAIGLSGLITPSLNEMIYVAQEADRQGLNVPILIGGATTSDLHTAVKIAPATRCTVVHSPDAAANVHILAHLLGPDRDAYVSALKAQQQRLRDEYERGQSKPLHTLKLPVTAPTDPSVHTPGIHTLEMQAQQVTDKINWKAFYAAWGMPGKYTPQMEGEALALYEDAQNVLAQIGPRLQLRGVIGSFEAHAHGDVIEVINYDGKGNDYSLNVARADGGQTATDLMRSSKCDCCDCSPSTRIEFFALSAAFGLDEIMAEYRAAGDEYSAMMAKFLVDRLTEAMADTVLKGGCRLAIGYPVLPDHALKRDVFELLDAEKLTGMRLTSSDMIIPAESICGLYMRHIAVDF